MNKFNVGDVVVLKSSPWINPMTIEKINDDGTYYCRWFQYVKRRSFEGRELNYGEFKEESLQYPPSRITHL